MNNLSPDILNFWPLSPWIQEYDPERAEHVINAIAGLNSETCAVTIDFAVLAAKAEWTWN